MFASEEVMIGCLRACIASQYAHYNFVKQVAKLCHALDTVKFHEVFSR